MNIKLLDYIPIKKNISLFFFLHMLIIVKLFEKGNDLMLRIVYSNGFIHLMIISI